MVVKRGTVINFGTETMDVPNVPPTAVISVEQWAEITTFIDDLCNLFQDDLNEMFA